MRLAALVAGAVLSLGCPTPISVPLDRQALVGTWRADQSWLRISADGEIVYRIYHPDGAVSIVEGGRILSFSPGEVTFQLVFMLTATAEISDAPYETARGPAIRFKGVELYAGSSRSGTRDLPSGQGRKHVLPPLLVGSGLALLAVAGLAIRRARRLERQGLLAAGEGRMAIGVALGGAALLGATQMLGHALPRIWWAPLLAPLVALVVLSRLALSPSAAETVSRLGKVFLLVSPAPWACRLVAGFCSVALSILLLRQLIS